MSTNYYWLVTTPRGKVVIDSNPDIHIGKRVQMEGGFTKMLWAHNQSEVIDICWGNTRREIIIDEYHKTYTGSEFLEILKNTAVSDNTQVGIRFS